MNARLNKLVAAMVPVLGMTLAAPAIAADAGRQAADSHTPSGATQQRTLDARDVRLSQLTGMEVRDAHDKRIGEINDVVVDLGSGKAQYAVVGFGGFMGVGEKLFAFPMDAFKVQAEPARTAALGDRPVSNTARTVTRDDHERDRSPNNALDNDGVRGDKGPVGTDRTARTDARDAKGASTMRDRAAAPRLRDVHLVLDVDKAKLKDAKGFDGDKWPDMTNATFGRNVVRDAGAMGKSGSSVAANAKLYRASKLIGADVHDAQNKDIGDIEDVVVNLRTGDLHYAVIEFDPGWLKGDKLVAVPVKALARAGDKDEADVRLNADRSALERAPAFARDAWPDLNRGEFRSNVDHYLAAWKGGTADRSMAADRGTAGSTATQASGANRSTTTGAAGTTDKR